MFKYCDSCIKKHKNKTCECKYNEVNRFIELINMWNGRNFILKSCPDEDREDIYTVDLKFVDENLGENIYIEVKEVKIGYGSKGYIGKENGQITLGNCINLAIDTLEEYKRKIMNKYIIYIPKTHIDTEEQQDFINKFTDFLNGKTLDNKCDNMNFSFIRSRNKEEINIRIFIKDESINKLTPNLAYTYDSEPRLISQIYNNINNFDKFVDGINRNFIKTEEVNNKFPKNDGKRVLLNILRFPYGEEIFFNTFLYENFYKLENIKDNIEINKYKSIDESYLLYYFEDGFYYENNTMKFGSKLLLCINILGDLNNGYLIKF